MSSSTLFPQIAKKGAFWCARPSLAIERWGLTERAVHGAIVEVHLAPLYHAPKQLEGGKERRQQGGQM
jgi:hypothetical protein